MDGVLLIRQSLADSTTSGRCPKSGGTATCRPNWWRSIVGLAVWLGVIRLPLRTAASGSGGAWSWTGRGLGGAGDRPLPGCNGAGALRPPHQPVLGFPPPAGRFAMMTTSVPLSWWAAAWPSWWSSRVASRRGLGVGLVARRPPRGIAASSDGGGPAVGPVGRRARTGFTPRHPSSRRPCRRPIGARGASWSRSWPATSAVMASRVATQSDLRQVGAPTCTWCSWSPTAR